MLFSRVCSDVFFFCVSLSFFFKMGYGSRAIDLLTRYYEGGLYSGTGGDDEEEEEDDSEEESEESSEEGSEEESSDEEEEEEGDASNGATGEDKDRRGGVLPSAETLVCI